jgi:ribulose kinase
MMKTLFSNITRVGLLGAALAGPAAGIAHADVRHDRKEIAQDQAKLRKDVRMHGRRSKQAARDRAELQRDYVKLRTDRYRR